MNWLSKQESTLSRRDLEFSLAQPGTTPKDLKPEGLALLAGECGYHVMVFAAERRRYTRW